ncbi:MAG: MotA/TolQ/ExbB proton channel family protein [Bdellovibrionaceae bacterium]|nr:MotA/TolQ/ExbB proton channel family protein [Pseudobdellovibrionaceae bacterium]
MNFQGLFSLAQGFADIILWILMLSSVMSIALILERFFTLGKAVKKNKAFRMMANDVIERQDYSKLDELAQDENSLPQKAMKHGLKHAKAHGDKGLDEVFSSFVLIEKPPLERYLNFLATVGSNAPFVGLLGTVMGIMKAFNDLAQNSAAGNEVVMLGIAHALIATAIGLFVAIPAVIGFNYYSKMVKDTVQTIEVAKELCLAYAKSKG